MNRTLTSPRPNGFPSPPRDGFPTRDVRFAQSGPLPYEGRGEGDESTVQGVKARNWFRRILTLRLRSEAMADKQTLSPDGGFAQIIPFREWNGAVLG
jgi:hypothetical protein